ncbi:EF-hand domain-containing protein [Aquisediminimonas sediminicola]|uniref:EF-hand domain-containing protein n=1 Tax=Alteraquisediminimonas sediminicola TaxID=2676787 RepID=UPI001C8E95E7|nr:EF-hand domain-containing protein [Aquisediminimonas sediminicola]
MKSALYISSITSAIFILTISTAQAVDNPPASPLKATARTAKQPAPLQLADLKKQLDANFAVMDGNHDGSISPAELAAGRTANLERQKIAAEKRRSEVFNRLDSNKDGTLSRAEWEAGNIAPKPPLIDVSKAFTRLDSNKDSKLSPQELQAPALQDFAKRDIDKNGILSGQERRPTPPQK